MSDRTSSYTANQTHQRDEIATIVSTIDRQVDKYRDLLPSSVSWADFRNAFLVSVQMNPRLLDADRQSLWLSLQKAAGDGLKPDGREAALVIFGDDSEDDEGNLVPSAARGKKKVVYMPMVAGLIKLVRNTGTIANIRAKLVYNGEQVIISDENGVETYKHVRTIEAGSMIDDSPENIIGAYAVVLYKDGNYDLESMTRRQIDRVRAVSRAKKGPWLPWADEMSKKTVLRRLIKRLEKSAELQKLDAALEHDETMTIEGVATNTDATEQIRGEFSADKQAAKPVTTNAANTNTGVAKTQRQAARQDPPREDESPHDPDTGEIVENKTGKPVPDAAKNQAATASAGQQTEAEIWPVNEIGEPDDDFPEPMSPLEFAKWFAARLAATKNPDALREHNADNVAEAGATPEALRIIQTALDSWLKTIKPAVEDAPVGTTKPMVAIPVPLTPKKAPHWPNYQNAVKEALPKLKTLADCDTWEALNKPNYDNRAIQIPIENWLRDRRKALTAEAAAIKQSNELIGADDTDTALKDNPPASETTAEAIARISIDVAALMSDDEVTAWTKRPDIVATMERLRKTARPAFDQLIALIDQRRLEVDEPA